MGHMVLFVLVLVLYDAELEAYRMTATFQGWNDDEDDPR